MRFDIKFLGIGSAFNVDLGNTAAFFKDKFKNLYLFDCGYDVFSKLKKYNILKDVNIVTVFLTHLHDDHCGSIGTLMYYCYFMLNKKINIIFPNLDLARLIKLQGGLCYCNFIINKEDIIRHDTTPILSYKFILTKHDKSIHSYSIKLCNLYDADGQTVWYSGDTQVLFDGENIFNKNIVDSSVNIFQDCTHESRNEKSIHMNLQTLCKLIPKDYRQFISCIHLGDVNPQKILQCGFKIPEIYKG